MTLDAFATIQIRDSTPGPGAYNLEQYETIGGKYSIHVAVRPRYREQTSLTSNIDYPPQMSTLNRRKQTIGTKPESRPQSARAPGPSYLPNPKEYFSKSVVIKNRYDDPDTSQYPGPATYSPQQPGASSKTKTPPMGPRAEIVLSNVPESPGPAAYDTLGKFGNSTPKYTIRPKTAELRNKNRDPGFEHNNQGAFGGETPKWTFPTATRQRGYDYTDTSIPGPGHYEDNDSIDRIRTPLGRMRKPEPEKEKRPLTANVELRDIRSFPQKRGRMNGKEWSMGSKSKRDIWVSDPDIPGPSFMPEMRLDLTPIKIGERSPLTLNTQDTPGPADYNPRDPSQRTAPSYSWKGPGARDGWVHTDSNPGPAEYSLVEEGNDKPKWTIGERSISRSTRSYSSMREVRSARAQTAFIRKG